MSNKYTYSVPFTEEQLYEDYINKIMTQTEIAKKYSTTQKVVWRALHKMNIPTRKAVKRESVKRVIGRYKGGRVLDKKVAKHTSFKDRGYVLIYAPELKCSNKSGYVTEHKINMLKHLNIDDLPKGSCIHHINMNKSDNRIENLKLCNKSEHAKYHSQLNDLIYELFKKGIMGFNDKQGYFLKEKEGDKNA